MMWKKIDNALCWGIHALTVVAALYVLYQVGSTLFL
jgi:hypothetical protein